MINNVEVSENDSLEPAPETIQDSSAPLSEPAPLQAEEKSESIAPPSDEPDYRALLEADMKEISSELFDGEAVKLTDLKNPVRYGALRDLGLTPTEAYLASGGRKEKIDNRAHLQSSVPRRTSSSFSEIPPSDLNAARELFSDMNDSEIRALYKKVTQ